MSNKSNTTNEISDNQKNQNTRLRKHDIVLIAIILIISICIFAVYKFIYNDAGNYVRIEVNGKMYKELPLNKDTEITIMGTNDGTNRLRIHDGYADMTDADCPDKLCVKQKRINSNGETIVCLPHKVVITVISGKKNELDGVAS